VAGMLIGLLSFKPHLGLLIPIALIAGGHWRAITTAALTILGLAAITTLLFGAHVWGDFIASAPFTRRMLEDGLVWFTKLQSPFSAVRLLDGSTMMAYGVQAVVSLLAALTVAWAWRRPVDDDLKNAALVTAIPLATPFVLDYDLLILALPIAWLSARSLRQDTWPWERTVLLAASFVPLLSRAVGAATHVLIAPVAVAALLVVLAMRIGAADFTRPIITVERSSRSSTP
jgi:alpha-1,2-mannosyltransferase